MTTFMDDSFREKGKTQMFNMTETKPSYDDRYVWMALAGIGVLTPIFVGIALTVTPGTGILLDLWLGFGVANLLVWPIVLVAGLVDSACRAIRTARIVKRSFDRKLELRRDKPAGSVEVEAMAA